jgi:ubiquitin carboxyl-terminal hydrolase 25/28
LPTFSRSNENFYDDVSAELEVLIFERLQQEGRHVKLNAQIVPVSALKDIERSLGCFDYLKRRTVDLTGEEHPYYASLGAMETFTDEFLLWAYGRQRRCDPINKPYYLDCLQDLAKGRKSSDLETKVVEAKSLGELGFNEIKDAYQFLALDPNIMEGDDYIIGVYKSRIESAPRQKDEARQCLKIIGEARHSDKIKAMANDVSMSYEDALSYLTVNADTDSDFIAAVAATFVRPLLPPICMLFGLDYKYKLPLCHAP